MTTHYTYRDTVKAAQKVNWKVDDLMGRDSGLDFTKPFLPEILARTAAMTFLSPDEQRTANHIRGHGYLYMFGLVEEFILPFVMDHARPQLADDDYRTRAFLQFAAEEAKHIHLFKRFRDAFTRDFGTTCEVIGPPADIAQAVLAKGAVAVAMLILHIEWMTQRHFVDSVRDDTTLDCPSSYKLGQSPG